MADWVHRTTKEHRISSDPPLADQVNWIRNPDMSAVAGETSDAWIIDGDIVRLPTEQEWVPINAARLEAAKLAKYAEIDANSARIVTKGVEVAPGVTISTSLQASQNLQDIWIGHQSGMTVFPVTISMLSGGTYAVANAESFMSIMTVFGTHKRGTLVSGQQLRAQVAACETVEDVEAVVDERT